VVEQEGDPNGLGEIWGLWGLFGQGLLLTLRAFGGTLGSTGGTHGV